MDVIISELDEDDDLAKRSIEEVYYLWRLAGGDLEGSLKKAVLVKSKPPITATSRYLNYTTLSIIKKN